ncbi:hypothetical protein [Maribacter sp. 2210JD10-5]|uniref:hypothetical protein n=1 Tax=Maribacter sp. 2210JD10-5 TaxID=3386272 RepID=UPI0039BD1E2A
MRKLVMLLLLFAGSCNKYDLPKCEFDDATQDLIWLKDIIEEREANPTDDMMYCYIVQGKLNKRPVFVLGDCNPLVNKVIFVLDCEGNAIEEDGRKIGANEVDIKNQKIIWQPENFACDLDL